MQHISAQASRIVRSLIALMMVVVFVGAVPMQKHSQASSASFQVDLLAGSLPFNHYWKRSVGSCHATFCLRSDWREQLKITQKELGFTGIRFQ